MTDKPQEPPQNAAQGGACPLNPPAGFLDPVVVAYLNDSRAQDEPGEAPA